MNAYFSLAPFYDKLTSDVPYDKFADFYEELFSLSSLKVNTVLDIACGTGTLTRILAQRGYDMIGVDASEEMLMEAADKLSDISPRPLLICQRMEELDLYGTVDAAVCSLDGMNYVQPPVLKDALRRIWLFIEPGGMFVFDVNTPFKFKNIDGEMFIDETSDLFCVWRAEYDEKAGECHYGMDIFSEDNGKWVRSREEHIEYSYDADFLADCLVDCGFEQICVYGELTLSPPKDDDHRIFISARKPK